MVMVGHIKTPNAAADDLPVFEKYDNLLPAELVRKGFAEGVLDVAGMRTRALEWAKLAGPAGLPGDAAALRPLSPGAIE